MFFYVNGFSDKVMSLETEVRVWCSLTSSTVLYSTHLFDQSQHFVFYRMHWGLDKSISINGSTLMDEKHLVLCYHQNLHDEWDHQLTINALSRGTLTDSVVMIQHRGDAVKPEAVEAVLLHPPAQVWQKEPQNLPASSTHKYTHKVRETPSCDLLPQLILHFKHRRFISTATAHSLIDNQSSIMLVMAVSVSEDFINCAVKEMPSFKNQFVWLRNQWLTVHSKGFSRSPSD